MNTGLARAWIWGNDLSVGLCDRSRKGRVPPTLSLNRKKRQEARKHIECCSWASLHRRSSLVTSEKCTVLVAGCVVCSDHVAPFLDQAFAD